MVQLSGDDLRMFAVRDVSGVYMSPRINRPFIETPDILCFLFDRVGPGEDVRLQLRKPNIDREFLNELVDVSKFYTGPGSLLGSCT